MLGSHLVPIILQRQIVSCKLSLSIMIYFLKVKNWEKVVKIKESHFKWAKQCNFGEAESCWRTIGLLITD